MRAWFKRRSNRNMVLWSIAIGLGYFVLVMTHIPDIFCRLFLSSTNFTLGAWWGITQEFENAALPPQVASVTVDITGSSVTVTAPVINLGHDGNSQPH